MGEDLFHALKQIDKYTPLTHGSTRGKYEWNIRNELKD